MIKRNEIFVSLICAIIVAAIVALIIGLILGPLEAKVTFLVLVLFALVGASDYAGWLRRR